MCSFGKAVVFFCLLKVDMRCRMQQKYYRKCIMDDADDSWSLRYIQHLKSYMSAQTHFIECTLY